MLTINLIESNNYNNQRLDKLNSTMEIIKQVLNSTDFKTNVLNFTTDGSAIFYYRKTIFGRQGQVARSQNSRSVLV